MKNILFGLLIFCYYSVFSQTTTYVETVKSYYHAKNQNNYNEIKKTISDSVTLIEGKYIMPYDLHSFYEFYKWDSVFKPFYKIKGLKTENNYLIFTIAQSNIRNNFLQNNPLTFKQKISFESGKISKIETIDYINVNWQVWEKEKQALVNWIKKNHPKLDGFINDMSMKGAQNYLKAIELYNNKDLNE